MQINNKLKQTFDEIKRHNSNMSLDEVLYAVYDEVKDEYNKPFDVLRNSGKKRFYDMTQAEKQQVKDLVIEVANNTSVKVAIVKDNLVVYKPGTTDIFYETPINPVNGDIVQTSRGLTVAVAGIISAIGIAIALRKVKVNA